MKIRNAPQNTKSADVMSASYGGILVAGHDGVAERGGGDAGADGGTVGRHQQRLREVEEGVEHGLVILADHRVELPGEGGELDVKVISR